MQINKVLLAPVILMAVSCNNRTEKEKPFEHPGQVSCYKYENNRDKMMLSIQNAGDSVTGELEINLYEKDKNKGTIRGEWEDGILLADYTFQSEGVESVRPVAFKKEGDNMVQGYGETETRNGKLEFRHPKQLNFDTAFVLRRADCR